MIRREDYLPIQAWMRDMGLTDKQLLIYALIFSYSRDGRSCWRGTAKHLAEWAGCQERNAKKIIRQLEDMGLVGHDVVAWSNGKKGGVRSEFWAVLPENVAIGDPAKRKELRGRINWTGKGRGVGSRSARGGRVPECPTPIAVSRYSNIYPCGGGKYNARSRAKKTTTTTGFLFEENGSGLTPGETLELPFKERAFRKAWADLLMQPAWAGKTPEALRQTLESLSAPQDAYLAAYCCRLAVQRGWDSINDPQAILDSDLDKINTFEKQCRALGEEGDE